jgi:micrococcal nuclease
MRWRNLLITGSLVAALVVAGCFIRPNYRAVDGDTFDAGGRRYRIANIDAPELRGRCWREHDLAIRARLRLHDLLAQGFKLDRVPCDTGSGALDRYGRRCVLVEVAGADVGERLIREGLASRWPDRKDWCDRDRSRNRDR